MEPVANNTAANVLAVLTQAAKPAQSPAPPTKPAVSSDSPEAKATPAASLDEVKDATQRVEKFVQAMTSDLQFTVDDSSGSFVIRVVDRATKEVIRQMPSEEMLVIAQALDRLQGLLVRQQA